MTLGPILLPGKDWWHAFLKRHPQLSLRTPQALQKCRAKACTPEAMNKWYRDYEQFLIENNLLDKPSRIWNCDESGFALSPRSSKVLAPRGTKHVYHSTSSERGQITTPATISMMMKKMKCGSSVKDVHIGIISDALIWMTLISFVSTVARTKHATYLTIVHNK